MFVKSFEDWCAFEYLNVTLSRLMDDYKMMFESKREAGVVPTEIYIQRVNQERPRASGSPCMFRAAVKDRQPGNINFLLNECLYRSSVCYPYLFRLVA